MDIDSIAVYLLAGTYIAKGGNLRCIRRARVSMHAAASTRTTLPAYLTLSIKLLVPVPTHSEILHTSRVMRVSPTHRKVYTPCSQSSGLHTLFHLSILFG